MFCDISLVFCDINSRKNLFFISFMLLKSTRLGIFTECPWRWVCLLFFTIRMRLWIWGKNTTEILLLSCHLKFGCMIAVCLITDFPGSTLGKESTCKCKRLKKFRFCSWDGKIPWSRKWHPTPVFLPGKFNGHRSLMGYSLWGCVESDMTEWLNTHTGDIAV